jgi:RNA polymerase sigma-70 factor (ECF subfamily)
MQPDRSQIHGWMVRLADGDRSAFDPLYRGTRPLLDKFAQRLLPTRDEAEDAAQQALLTVFSRAARFDPERDALSWIFGIVANECRTRRRSRVRRDRALERFGSQTETAVETPAEADVIERDLALAATEVLASLPARDIETIVASLNDSRPATVASATFRKRLERARRRLSEAWRLRHES